MSIKFTGQKSFVTALNTAVFGSATECSIHLKFRFELDGNAAQTTLTWLFGGSGYAGGYIQMNGAGVQPGTVKVIFAWKNAAQAVVSRTVEVATGAVYTLCQVFSQTTGHRCYVSGQRFNLSALTGTLYVPPLAAGSGIWAFNPLASSFSLEDVAVWKGHALSDQQVADLRDGVLDPDDITSGDWRGVWTMRGTPGATVVPGAGGLLNSVGDQLWPLATAAGTGTAVYGDPLVWEPAVEISEAHVGTGGKTLFVSMRAISSGHETLTSACNTLPTIKANGASIGQATLILADGNMVPAAFLLPRQVNPGEAVTITAPANWLATVGGAAAAVADYPVANKAGQRCFVREGEKSLRMGVNIESYPTAHQATGELTKNWATRLSAWSNVAEYDENLKPVRLTSPATSSNAGLHNNTAPNSIDLTGVPGPEGLFAIGWDDTNPSQPTTFGLFAGSTTTTTVTGRPEFNNPGTLVGGVLRGIVKVYQVSRKIASGSYQTNISATMTVPSGNPRFENLIINHESDFKPGTPTVLDNSNPYALSSGFLDKYKNAGSVRSWGSLTNGADMKIAEKEHVRKITDFGWGFSRHRLGWSVRYTLASPFSVADTPWFYNFQAGDKYPATLSAPIDADDTVITLAVNSGQGNDVLIGSRLFMGSEVLRVDEIDGNQYTVSRGLEDTVPAAHAAGTIQVGYRMPMLVPGGNVGSNPWYNGSLLKLTSQAPHRLWTGYPLMLEGTWPVFTYDDGSTGSPTGSASNPTSGGPSYGGMVVTGRDTVIVHCKPFHEPSHTITAPVTLDPLVQFNVIILPPSTALPYRMHAKIANQCEAESCFISITCHSTRDFVYWIAHEMLELDPGRLLYLEPGNELWNFPAISIYPFTVSAVIYPGKSLYTYYMELIREWRAIFEEVWGEAGRAGDIRFYINDQATFSRNILSAATNAEPPVLVDAVAIAPYASGEPGYIPTTTQAAFVSLDVPEILDVWIHHFWHTTGDGIKRHASNYDAQMEAYTAATGLKKPHLVSYEGFIETMLKNVPNAEVKEHDLHYHPNMYLVVQDLFALYQAVGYRFFNCFCSFATWPFARGFMWGIYTHHFQKPGRGDGTDGLANNLDFLKRPGLPNSLPATVNQDANCVSPRGLAWKHWNEPAPLPPAEKGRGVRMMVSRRNLVGFRGY